MYVEEGDYVAHALEPDIVGCGDSADEALDDLRAALSSQITFAIEQNDLTLIQGNAPRKLEKTWEQHQQAALLNDSHNDIDAEYLGFSSREISELRQTRMEPVCA